VSDAFSERSSLSPEVFRRVDSVCQAFEAAWKAGQRPTIEPLLVNVEEPMRTPLLRELILLEIDYRQRASELPAVAEYRARFAADAPLIEGIFRGLRGNQDQAGSAALGPFLAQAAAQENIETTTSSVPPHQVGRHLRCPHCHNPIELVEHVVAEITCPSCGSTFAIDPGATEGWSASPTVADAEAVRVGRFELLGQLGRGAFGTVWKARDSRLDRLVAVKIPRKGQLARDEVELFLREARAAAQLRHPHIVSVHEAGQEGELVYIVSDLIEGVSLADWLAGSAVSSTEAATMCVKIAAALDYAHERGIVHRDLKPQNIMVDAAGEPHIMDFGLAKREAGEITMTVEGAIFGTPAYMSPEQAQGEGHRGDRRMDVYSLGVILFEMLTGERPFRGNVRMLLQQVIEDEPPSPRKLDARVPRDLETICLKCLAKDPSRRYPTAKDVSAELGRWLRGEPILARPVSRAERAWRWCRRNPVVAGLTGTAGFLLVAVAVVALWGYVLTSRALDREANQHRLAVEAARREAAASKKATAEAERANLAAQKETLARQATEKIAYRQAIALTQAHLAKGDPFQAAAVLDACPPHLRHWEWGYLKQSCGKTLVIPAGGYNFLDLFTADNKLITQTSTAGEIRMWDAETGRSLPIARNILDMVPTDEQRMQHNEKDRAWIKAYGWTRDAQRMAFAAWTREVYDILAQRNAIVAYRFQQLAASRFPPSGASSKITPPEAKGPGPELSREVRIVEIGSGKTLSTLRGHTDSVTRVEFSHDGTWLASGAMDGEVILWNAARGEKVHVLRGHEAPVKMLRFSPDGRWFASGGEDGEQVLWNVAQGQQVRVLREPLLDATSPMHGDLQFSPNGNRLALVLRGTSGIKNVTFWDVGTGSELSNLNLGQMSTPTAVWSPDSSRVALRTGNEIRVLAGEQLAQSFTVTLKQGNPLYSGPIAFSPDGNLMVVGKDNGEILVCNANTGAELRTAKIHDHGVSGLIFSADGRRLASTGDDTTVRVWDVSPSPPQGTILSFADIDGIGFFSDDGTLVADGSSGVVYNVQTGKEAATLREYAENPCMQLPGVFSADNRQFMAHCIGNIVKVWDVVTGEPCFRISSAAELWGYNRDFTRIAVLSPIASGKSQVSRNPPRELKVYDANQGKQLDIAPSIPAFGPLQFSPRGDEVYSCNWNGTTGTWGARDIRSGALRLSVPAHCVECVAMSPDGSRVCLRGVSTAVTILDTATGRQLFTLRGAADLILSVDFSPDGERIVTCSQDGAIRIWDATSGEQLLLIQGSEMRWGRGAYARFVGPKNEKLVVTRVRADQRAETQIWDCTTPVLTPTNRGAGPARDSAAEAPQRPAATAWPAKPPAAPPGAPLPAIAPFDENKAKEHQQAWAKHLGARVELSNSVGMKFVLIPPGEFLMGSPKELIEEESRTHADDPWYLDHLRGERPQHRVRITRPFWLGTIEVTQDEFERTMGKSPTKDATSSAGASSRSRTTAAAPDTGPQVERRVSWDEAVEFCRRLAQLPEEKAAGRQYQLPTEAQWEYACRAGSTTRYCFGDAESALSDYAWYNKSNMASTIPSYPAGKKSPNSWGLFDMHGNTWEWCQDWYDSDYYAKSPMDDPPGPLNGSSHVLRGGGQFSSEWFCRSANRASHKPGYRSRSTGFRVCIGVVLSNASGTQGAEDDR